MRRLVVLALSVLAVVVEAAEIRAVWEQSGRGLYPGDWAKTFRVLRAHRVTDLFVNVAGPDFAHYRSGVLPLSQTAIRQGDQLAACLAAAKGTGVRVHAWVMCFNATRASAAIQLSFKKRGWRLRNAKGELTNYLDPANPDLRWRMLKVLGEIAENYPVNGIHLDFVRWYEGAAKPRDAARKITTFVESAHNRVRRYRPQSWLTAAVLGTETCVKSVGQNWGEWIDRGLVDYAVPMNYIADRGRYAATVARQGRQPARAKRTVGGIGVTAKESTLTRAAVAEQIRLARAAGFAGVALFDLDETLVKKILPGLK